MDGRLCLYGLVSTIAIDCEVAQYPANRVGQVEHFVVRPVCQLQNRAPALPNDGDVALTVSQDRFG